MTVPAAHAWKSNAELIQDVAKLGYIEVPILDPTYGEGTFWKALFHPTVRIYNRGLFASDIDPNKAPDFPADFTDLPWPAKCFNTVVFDPPYKLNGTPGESDERYGVHVVKTWQDRRELMTAGFFECARVLKAGGHLLVKCQDQVCSGKVRWQTDWYTLWASQARLDKIDRFDMLGTARSQPMKGRTQKHAHGRPSTLLVFKK